MSHENPNSITSKIIAATEDTLEGIGKGIKKLQYPAIYIPITIGFLIFYYSLVLHVVIEEQQHKWNSNLKKVDRVMEDIVDGINYFLLEAPEKAQALADCWIHAGDEILDKICTVFVDVANMGTQVDFSWFVAVINKYLDYVHVPASIPAHNWNPEISYNAPQLENFVHFGNFTETGILVPKIPFSSFKTLHPVVDEIAGTAKTIVEVSASFGLIVFLFGSIPVLMAIILPFREGRSRCGFADFFIFQMIWRGIKTLLKWRVFIPLLIGGCLCFASISLAVLVKQAESKMIPPLQQADKELEKFMNDMNSFTTGFTTGFINFTNGCIDEVNWQTYSRTSGFIYSIQYTWSRALFELQDTVLEALDAPFQVTFFPDSVTIPEFDVLKRIPNFNTSVMEIPEDVISLEDMLAPVIQRMLDVPRVIHYWLWILGLSIAVIPAITLVCNILYPLLPQRVTNILEGKNRQKRIFHEEEIQLPDIKVETPGPTPTVTPDTSPSPTPSPSPSKLSLVRPLPSPPKAKSRRSLSFGTSPLQHGVVDLSSLDVPPSSSDSNSGRTSNVQTLAAMLDAQRKKKENSESN